MMHFAFAVWGTQASLSRRRRQRAARTRGRWHATLRPTPRINRLLIAAIVASLGVPFVIFAIFV